MERTEAEHETASKQSLTGRLLHFFVAFLILLAGTMLVNGYQDRAIIEPENKRTEGIRSISRLLTQLEEDAESMQAFRWDYGNAYDFLEEREQQEATSKALLSAINGRLDEVGEAQYLLCKAAWNTFESLERYDAEFKDALLDNDQDKASALFYSELLPCHSYLIKYTQQLLETAIAEDREAFSLLLEENRKLTGLQAVLLAVGLCFATLLVTSFLKLVSLVVRLSGQARQISLQHYDVPDMDSKRTDEVGLLVHTFNDMKHSMRHQVEVLEEKNAVQEQLYRKEKETLELQSLLQEEKLQQLRSQVNPHFLFNTLNVIMITAENEGAKRTPAMLAHLSRLYRYAIASDGHQVPLSREIQIIESLSALYHARFGDKVAMHWQAQLGLDVTRILVPSFILQPLVENAFQYGIAHTEKGGTVQVDIQKQGDLLSIEVRDDGKGMDKETLQRVRSGLERLEGSHIGLANVASRLRLAYPGKTTFTIDSALGKGTVVRFTLPYQEEDT